MSKGLLLAILLFGLSDLVFGREIKPVASKSQESFKWSLQDVLSLRRTTRMPFTGTYLLGKVPEQKLDFAPLVARLRSFDCPADIREVSRDAVMHALVWVKSDGGVTQVLVTHGEDIRFRDSVHQTLSGWKFVIPTKNGKAVEALLSLRLKVSGNGIGDVEVELQKEPNQSSEPTPTSVTPRAEPRVAPAAVVAHL